MQIRRGLYCLVIIFICTDESDIPVEALARDVNNIVNNGYGYVEMNNHSPEDSMHVGHNFRDVPRANQRQNLIGDGQLQRTVIHDLIASGHWERPVFNNRNYSN